MSFNTQSPLSSQTALRLIQEAEDLKAEMTARAALKDKWFWLTNCTKTQDEQDPANPYKPFPDKEYLRLILEVVDHEEIVIIEKSRTMMCSWDISGWCAHFMFTHDAAGVIFQSRDEDRAVHDVDYVKCLWDKSLDPLKKRWNLQRPLDKMPYNWFGLVNKSWCMGITGGPDKIRSEHPTIVVLDEAAYIESDANFNVAMAARPLKLIALSSANNGWFRELTEFATPVDWPEYTGQTYLIPPDKQLDPVCAKAPVRSPLPGMLMRRTKQGFPVIRVHWSADPEHDAAWAKKQRSRYTSQAWWNQEMEINYDAMSGQRVYPEFDQAVHVIPDERIPKRLCRFMAIDPHPRTPHAALWVGIDEYGDWYAYRELWPSVVYGEPRTIKDDEEDRHFTVKDYAQTMAVLEGNGIRINNEHDLEEWGEYVRGATDVCGRCGQSVIEPNRLCLRHQRPDYIIERFMDQAGKGFIASGENQQEETYAERYYRYGIQCVDPIKSHKAGEDAIRLLLKPRGHDFYGMWPRLHVAASLVELQLEFLKYRYKRTHTVTDEKELKQEGVDSRCHLLDLLRYLATARLSYVPNLVS